MFWFFVVMILLAYAGISLGLALVEIGADR